MGRTIAILIFDGVEEMDFAGPWEVLSSVLDQYPEDRVVSVSHSLAPVTCEKGLRVLPDVTYEDLGQVDVLVVPGGSGARREIDNPETIAWLHRVAPGCSWVTSVCTGAFLLVGAGLADGRQVTTHHRFTQLLRDQYGAQVVEGVRFIRDGNFVSAGGVMSGIEMSLWLVGELYGQAAMAEARDYIAYEIPPRDSGAS